MLLLTLLINNYYVPFVYQTSNNQQVYGDSGILYNPNTNTLTAGNFSGTSTYASRANKIDIANNTNTNATRYLTFTNTYYQSNQSLQGDEHLSYHPSTNTLSAINFSGLATIASRANKIDITANAANSQYYVPFVYQTSNNQQVYGDSGMQYNPSSNTLTAGTFSGTATYASRANKIDIANNTTTNATRYLTFTNTYYQSDQTLQGDEQLSYHPSTNTLSAINFSGLSTLASRAEKVDVTANAANSQYYVPFVYQTSNNQQLYGDAGILYNPSTNTLTAGTFSGTSTYATRANKIDIANNTNTNATRYLTFSTTYYQSNQSLQGDEHLYYNPSSNILTAGKFSGDGSLLTNISSISITSNNSENVTHYPTFVDGVSGAQSLDTDSAFSYNPSTNILTAGTFSGTSTLATLASTVTITANNSENVVHYPVFVDGVSGAQSLDTDSAFSYNPNTNILTAGKFAGDASLLTGNINAATITITANNDENVTHYPTLVDGVSGAQSLDTDSAFSYNPSTNTLVAGIFSGTSTLATLASTVTITSNNSENVTHYPTLVDGVSGAQSLDTDSAFSYNPSTNTLVAGYFSGDASLLTGNINAATITITSNNSENVTHYPVFVDGVSGAQALDSDSAFNYNPSTNTLVAGTFSGTSTLATLASTVTITANNDENVTHYPTFVDGVSGAQGLDTDSAFSYNPSTNTLVAGYFSGDGSNLTGVGGTITALNNATANELVTVGATTTELDAEANLTFDGSTLTVGGDIKPAVDNSSDIGSTTKRWANLYTADVHLNNEGTDGNEIDGTTGDWNIQEGEDDLYLLNRKSGKKYKFKT